MSPMEGETMIKRVSKERTRMSRERFKGFMAGESVANEMTKGPGHNLRLKRREGNSKRGIKS